VGNIRSWVNRFYPCPHPCKISLRDYQPGGGIYFENIRVLVLVSIYKTINELQFIQVKSRATGFSYRLCFYEFEVAVKIHQVASTIAYNKVSAVRGKSPSFKIYIEFPHFLKIRK